MDGLAGMMGMMGMGRATEAASEYPEEYAMLQGDRTKQMLAQLLLARGMQQQPPGQMAGRFYVPNSPLQGIAGLAQAGAGAYLMNANDQKRMEMAKALQARQQGEVEKFQKQLAPQQGQVTIDATRAEMPDTWDVDALQGGPQVGTQPLPNDPRAHVANAVPLVDRGGMQPTSQTLPVEVPRSKEEVKQALMQAMMGTNPRLREAAKFMAQQQQAEELKREDQTIRRESTASNESMRLEQMKTTAALTMMQIDSRERAGQDVTDLKRALADQTAEIKKLEIGSRERMASAHDQTLKEIAGMKGNGGKEEKAREAKEAGYQQVQELTAQLKSYHDDLRAGGGETDTEKGPLENLKAAVSGSTPGQILGKTFGTKNQEARNKVAMTRPLLMASIMKATGMSAKSLDSNVELKLWLSTATDPEMGYQANMQALENIHKFIEKTRGTGSAPAAAPSMPSGAAPSGVRKYNPATGKIE